jgi:hypothetical protein
MWEKRDDRGVDERGEEEDKVELCEARKLSTSSASAVCDDLEIFLLVLSDVVSQKSS